MRGEQHDCNQSLINDTINCRQSKCSGQKNLVLHLLNVDLRFNVSSVELTHNNLYVCIIK